MNLGMQGIGIMNNELDSLGSASADLNLFQTSQFNSLDQNNPLLHNMHTPNNAVANSNLQQQNQQKMQLKQQMQKLSCDQLEGLSKGQIQICHLNKDHIYFIGKAARMGISECQHQFKKSRWNCSTYDDSSVFGPILETGSKEVAFTHAISSAAVVHSLARACRDGALSNCGCSRAKRPDSLRPQYKWAGCGDNVEYSYRFGKPFVDVKEEEQSFNKLSKRQGRKLMNLHNSEAGRLAVIKKTRVACKCHGVSGSCSIVTCWQQLSTFREVGDFLKDRYDAATEVRLNKRGKLQVVNKKFAKPTKLDLVYIEDSPDICLAKSPLTTIISAPEVEQLPTSNSRLVAKRPLIAKANKQSLSKKSRKYRSNKSSRQSRQAGNKLSRTSTRTAQRRTGDRVPKAQRLVSENGKQENNSKLDNPTEEDNQTFKEEDLNQFNGQSSLIPQLTDQQQQELTEEQKEQYTQLMNKQETKEDVEPIKQKEMVLLGTQGRECNRTSLGTDNCSILCCGRGYHTERVLVKEKCNCKFRWCCEIECDTCKYYKIIHTCK